MKTLKWYVFVIACILVSLSAHAWAAPAYAPFGQTATGTISTAGQSVSCTFSGNANDVLDPCAIDRILSCRHRPCPTPERLGVFAHVDSYGRLSSSRGGYRDLRHVRRHPSKVSYCLTIGTDVN